MERATLAYGEARSGKTLNTRKINQLTELGVPVWAELQKFTGQSVESIHKLIEKHRIDSTVLDKIFKDLTTGDSLFADGMKKFADTFQGAVTTFEDKASQASRDIGFIINDWTGDILKQINNSGAWNKVHGWFEEVRKMSDSVRSFISTIPTTPMMGAFGPAMKQLQGIFREQTKWINSFFTEVSDPINGSHKVLNATGSVEIIKDLTRIRQFFDGIAQVADSVVKTWSFLDAKEKEVEKWLKDHNLLNAFGLGSGKGMSVTPADAVRNAQDRLNSLVNAGADDAAIEKAKQDLINAEATKKSADAQDKLKDATQAIQASLAAMQAQIAKATGGSRGTGGMLRGDSAGSGNVRVEGFGPLFGENGQITGNHGNRLAMGDYAVSPNLLNGHKPGDTFWYRDGNGMIRHGRYEDTSMKAPGVPNRDIINYFESASIIK